MLGYTAKYFYMKYVIIDIGLCTLAKSWFCKYGIGAVDMVSY